MNVRCRVAAIVSSLAMIPMGLRGQPAVARTEFVQVQTDDGVTLSGAIWLPAGERRPTAVVVTAGTGSEFFDLAKWGDLFAGAGYPTVILNRREHGLRFGYEPFEASALDVRYAVDLATKRGAQRVVLVGHSYGTVVAPYYLSAAHDKRVSAAILLAAVADMRAATVRILGRDRYDEAVNVARQMVTAGRGDETYVMPAGPTGQPALMSYAVFLNKRGPDAKAAATELLKTADIPILAVRDPADPFPGTLPPAQQQLEAATRQLEYVLLPDTHAGKMDPGAHAFAGREREVFDLMMRWLARHGL